MSEQLIPESTAPEPPSTSSFGDGTGIALGLSLGALAGLTVLGDLGLGLGLGLVLGVAYDVVTGRRSR